MDEARPGKSPLGPVAGVLLGTALLGLGGCLVFGGVAVMEDLLGRTTFLVAGICFLLLGILAVGIGIFRSRWKDSAAQKPPLQQRAESLGQPTEPEAYQDGGLTVAATAYDVEEAELVALVLRGEGIPAWVDGAAVAGWYWHFRFGLSSGGVRVMVPLGRLSDAQAVIAEHAEERAAEPDIELGAHAETEREDPGAALHQSARRLAYLLLIGLTAPIVFVLAIRLLLRIRRQRIATGLSDELRKARRLAIGTALVAGLGCGTVGAVLTLSVTSRVGL
ncbi:MAG TPA: hypothetical protein VMY35_10810 [Phycisphaerae bacterium]|nr:hypothetical protein [Phycisphaerae bacterium]